MACEDWPVEGKMSHIVDSVYMYCVFKVTYIVKCTCTCMVHYHTGHMMKLFFLQSRREYMYMLHNKQLVIRTVYTCNLLYMMTESKIKETRYSITSRIQRNRIRCRYMAFIP